MADLKTFRISIGFALIALGALLALIPDHWIGTVFGMSRTTATAWLRRL
jgi:hypothetical protein